MTMTANQYLEREHIFHGTGFAVTEIELSLAAMSRKVRQLRAGNCNGSAVDQKLAAEAIAKYANQINVLAETIVGVTCRHLNRRSRV